MSNRFTFILSSLFFTLLMLFSAVNVSASHIASLSQDVEQKDIEYSYDNEEMSRFLFLKKAKDRKDELVKSLNNWHQQQDRIIHNMTNDRGLDGLINLSGVFALMMIAGMLFERLASFKLNRICNRLWDQKKDTWGDNVKLLIVRAAFQFLGLGIFVIVAGIIATYFFSEQDPFRVITLIVLTLVLKIRALSITLSLILAPYAQGLRLLTMDCYAARRLYFSILLFISTYLVITTAWRILGIFSLDPIMFALIVPMTGLLLNVSSIIFVWFNHKVITDMFTSEKLHRSNFTQLFSQIWPTLITFWLLVIWSIWAMNEFLGNYAQAEQLTPAWWLTFSFPILDRIIFVLLTQLKHISWLQSHSYEKRCDIFIGRVVVAIRITLFIVVIYLIQSSFGYNAWEMLTEKFGGILKLSVDVLVVIILAYALWEIIQSAIERHLPYDVVCNNNDDGLASLEGDGGGSGASRSETLLPLVRSFLLVFLLVSVILTVLSIIGVEIAPLLAGAGIIGIAVGFGAQKLVQDVISGIFFLLDDAFRRGEYIEAASLRGTVERISVRSIRLRHHLGAVQTIPFSEIATVRNLSRDWITMKLEFRLDYRTDVEKVRKLIKKVGLSMQEHPEYGQHFLLPLKSQGVIRVEESALIFRMKFTCIPGEQWVIRREAFRLVKDSLKANDIEFAHRSVHVLMQPAQPAAVVLDKTTANTPETSREQLSEALAQDEALNAKLAGAAASDISTAIQRNNKIDQDFD